MKVDILIKTTIDINLEHYPSTVTTVEEAVAYDVDTTSVWELLEAHPDDELFLVDVKPTVEEKNELSIMAERMSKELTGD